MRDLVELVKAEWRREVLAGKKQPGIVVIVLLIGLAIFLLLPDGLKMLALVIGGVAVVGVVVNMVRGRTSTRTVPTMHTDASSQYWEGSGAGALEIVRMLSDPKVLNWHLYMARLYVVERPGVRSVRRAAPEGVLERSIEWWRSRSKPGIYTVEGERLTVPRLVTIDRTPVGPIAKLTAIPGETEAGYDYAADILAVSLRVREVRVSQSPDDRAHGLMSLTFVTADPLMGETDEDFFGSNPALSPLLLPIARNELGGVYPLPVHHTLIVGATGSGKGGVLQGMIRQLAPWCQSGHVRLFGADPKRAELKGFERSSLFDVVAFDLDDIAEMVDSIVTNILRPRQALSGRSFELSTDNPLVVLIIDEFSSVVKDKNFVKSGLYENLNVLLSQGRSDGVYVVAASQEGQKEVLGQLRQHFANRIALRLDTSVEVDMVLGSGSLALGAEPHLIPKATESNGYATAGIAYIWDEGKRPMRTRFPYTSDAEIDRLIADTERTDTESEADGDQLEESA